MPDYKNAKIYKIVSNNTADIYIGSTTGRLRRRLLCHVSHYKAYLKKNMNYITSYNVIEHGNYDIILLEKYPCNDNEELHARERWYIENTPCVVNKNRPCTTIKEKKEYDKKYSKQHRIDNKEHHKEYDRKRDSIKITCEVCNCLVNLRKIKRHNMTKKHINKVEGCLIDDDDKVTIIKKVWISKSKL